MEGRAVSYLRDLNHARLKRRRGQRVHTPDPGYPIARGTDYRDLLERLHAETEFDWYLEIGTETGRSLEHVRANVISVDPDYRLNRDVVGTKGQTHLFQQGSDDFFASGFLARNGIRIDVAFLDGMHLVEFLLRDFINTERACRADGMILLHDCVPFTAAMCQRAQPPGAIWTGDVWKLVPILQRHRPDLRVSVLDAGATGLVMVTGLDPASTVLSSAYDRILAEYVDLSVDDFGLAALNETLKLEECDRLFHWHEHRRPPLGQGDTRLHS